MFANPRYDYDGSVQDLAAADRQAFTAFYQQYYLAVYHFARKMINDPQQAEDITAEAFIKLWRQVQAAGTVRNVKAFLFITAKNACLDHLKTVRLHEEKEKEIEYLAAQEAATGMAVAEIRAEVLQYVYLEIEKLPKKCREIFKLSYLEGLKVAEVAEQLQISEQTVSNQRSRALKILRLALQDKQWLLLLWLIDEGTK